MKSLSNKKLGIAICPLCKFKIYKNVCVERGFFIVQCKSCSLVFVVNKPSEKELDSHYASFFHGQENSQWDLFENRIFLQTINHIEKEFEKASVLDVGCGYGNFLDFYKKRNKAATLYGLEPYSEPAKIARKKGFVIFEYKLEEFEKMKLNRKFNVITLWWVLEHLRNPFEIIKKLEPYLERNGLLIIRVPNINFLLFIHRFKFIEKIMSKSGFSLSKQVNPVSNKTSFFDVLGAPYHLFGFNKRTLKRILGKSGFKNINFKMTGPVQTGNALRNVLEWCLFLSAKAVFYISFKKLYFYHDIMVYARRK